MEEIYYDYKGRWSIETYKAYLNNDADFNALKIQDYYVQHGFDFIMLVTGLIHSRLSEAVRSLKKSSISKFDILIKAGHIAICIWCLRMANGDCTTLGRKILIFLKRWDLHLKALMLMQVKK